MNGKVSAVLKVIAALVGAIVIIGSILTYIGGEIRALEDHITASHIHPEKSAVEHMAEDVTNISKELKEFRKETSAEFKDLRRRLDAEHPATP